jgi:hypothetical protein
MASISDQRRLRVRRTRRRCSAQPGTDRKDDESHPALPRRTGPFHVRQLQRFQGLVGERQQTPHQSNYMIYPDVPDQYQLTQYSIISLNIMTSSVSLKVKPNRTRPGAARCGVGSWITSLIQRSYGISNGTRRRFIGMTEQTTRGSTQNRGPGNASGILR